MPLHITGRHMEYCQISHECEFHYRWVSQNDSHHFNVGVIFSTPVSNSKSPDSKKKQKETRFNLPKDDQSISSTKDKAIVFSKHISTSLEIFPTRRLSKVCM